MAIPFADLTRKALTPLIAVCLVAALGSAAVILQGGGWRLLWVPCLALMFSRIIFPLILLPAAFFSGVMQAAGAVYPKVAKVCLWLTFGWVIAVLGLYQFGIFHLGAGLMEEPAPARFPVLVWTIAIAVLPWALFALRDRDNILFTGIVYMMTVSALVSLPVMIFYAWPVVTGFWLFCGLMAAMLSLQAAYEHFFLAASAPKVTDAPAMPAAEEAPPAPQDQPPA